MIGRWLVAVVASWGMARPGMTDENIWELRGGWPAFPTRFEWHEGGALQGHIRRVLGTLRPAFELSDAQGDLQARSTARLFSWGLIADILDARERLLGRIEEELWRLHGWPEYKIFDAEGALVAIGRMDPFGLELRVHHPEQEEEVFAALHRTWFYVGSDCWTVRMFSQNVNPLLLAFLAAYQTTERQF